MLLDFKGHSKTQIEGQITKVHGKNVQSEEFQDTLNFKVK